MHHPDCTDIESLQTKMEQMAGPCGNNTGNGGIGGGGFVVNNTKTGTGSRSNRSRRGLSRQTAESSIDMMDGTVSSSKLEKTVNFANCVSPPSPNVGLNNESYPCDCCQLEDSQFMSQTRRSLNHMPMGGGGPSLMHFPEVRYYIISYDHTSKPR